MGRIIRYVYGNIRLCYLLYDDTAQNKIKHIKLSKLN